MTSADTPFRCGHVAIVGRPNVGKSTLLNRLLEQKISITSRKPQTTRHQILGIHTTASAQFVFVDTPGWQQRPKRQLNRLMNRQVTAAIGDVDCILMLCDARAWRAEDDIVAGMVLDSDRPALLAVNKHDLLKQKNALLPLIDSVRERYPDFTDYMPVCARTGDGLDRVCERLAALLPERDALYEHDQLTDRSERFLCGEIVREKCMHYLGDELPYRSTVVIEEFIDEADITRISATVWVDRESQKPIVIGKGGDLLKRISSDARRDVEALLGRRVYLKVWVRTRRGWSDNVQALRETGLHE